MAKSEPHDFKLTGGLAEARRLVKYATSAGAAATQVLVRIVRDGGDHMRVREPRTRAAAARATIMELLDKRADPRWAQELLGVVEGAPRAATDALVRLRAGDELCDLVVRTTLDEIARFALLGLSTLRDRRASQLLVAWLQVNQGTHEPMLVTALGECGDAEAIAILEQRLETAGPRAGFYTHAIEAIQARCAAPPQGRRRR